MTHASQNTRRNKSKWAYNTPKSREASLPAIIIDFHTNGVIASFLTAAIIGEGSFDWFCQSIAAAAVILVLLVLFTSR